MPSVRNRLAPFVVAAVALGLWATGLEPFSDRATGFVIGAGLAAVVAGVATRPAVAPPRSSAGAATPWLVLVGVLAMVQLIAFSQQPRSDHPTLSSLANTVLDPRPVRALAFAAWLVVMVWLARR